MPIKLFFIFSLLLFAGQIKSQDLGNYKWKNRLLLIIGDDPSGDFVLAHYTEQKDQNKERKLIPIVVKPDGYFDTTAQEYVYDQSIFTNYGSNTSFTIVLIGLDGDVKARFNEVVSIDRIYDLIDQMPMRKNEMKNN